MAFFSIRYFGERKSVLGEGFFESLQGLKLHAGACRCVDSCRWKCTYYYSALCWADMKPLDLSWSCTEVFGAPGRKRTGNTG